MLLVADGDACRAAVACDETNTFNLAHMPSLRDIWQNPQFDSFPSSAAAGARMRHVRATDGDIGIRIFGLGIGLFFLSSPRWCQRWIGGRTPILSIALLGGLRRSISSRQPTADGLVVPPALSFGTIWRVVESPMKSRILSAGFICLLFADVLLYSDATFLGQC